MKRIALILVCVTALVLGCKETSSDKEEAYSPFTRPPSSEIWTKVTPAGITVITSRSTIAQYESLYGYWGNIDWETLDELFGYAYDYYCNQLGWDCKHASPSMLTVYIKPWDGRCENAENNPQHRKKIYDYINGKWQCVTGWYWQRTVYIHLGEDPGWDHTTIYNEDPLVSADFYAFQETAYEHELLHFFQELAGLPFSQSVMVGNSGSIPVYAPYTPPVAAFSASSLSGYAPLEVTFTDYSANSPTSWYWDFQNDGTDTSSLQNPTYTYTTPGTYAVKLTVTNGDGSDDEVKVEYITVW